MRARMGGCAPVVRVSTPHLRRYKGDVEDLGLDFTVDDETFGQVGWRAAAGLPCLQSAHGPARLGSSEPPLHPTPVEGDAGWQRIQLSTLLLSARPPAPAGCGLCRTVQAQLTGSQQHTVMCAVQVRSQELRPGGASTPVTDANRLQFCYLLAHWHLHGRLSASAGAFASGLHQVGTAAGCMTRSLGLSSPPAQACWLLSGRDTSATPALCSGGPTSTVNASPRLHTP